MTGSRAVRTIALVTTPSAPPFSQIDDIEERGSSLVIMGWMLLADGPPEQAVAHGAADQIGTHVEIVAAARRRIPGCA